MIVPMGSARLVVACTALLTLAACGAQTPQLQREADAQQAASSHLENDTDLPITIDADHGKATLAPHDHVVSAVGTWMVPRGYVCTWHDAHRTSGATVTVRATDFDTWTTYTGYQQVIDTCAALR